MNVLSAWATPDRRVRFLGGLAAVGILCAVAAPMVGVAPASAVAPSTVPCGQLGTVTASASPRQCVLAAGEAIEFVIVAGNGGNGGAGGPGGSGCSGEDGFANAVLGGFGGGGGVGGAGGRGAAVSGTYANNTGSPMTLEVVAGANGTNGAAGSPASTGCVGGGGPADGGDGGNGTPGANGALGGVATISALNSNGPASLIVAAFGGAGGTGGLGGAGGQGGRQTGTPGANGAPGAFGTAGAAGSTDPATLPAGMALLLGDGNPRVTFTAVAPASPAVMLPPGIGDLVTQPVVAATTIAPVATTVPQTTVPPPTTDVPTTTAPAPVPFEGVLPELAPGSGQVSEDGVATPVEVFVENRTDLVLQGDDFEMRLTGECAAGCLIETTQDGRAVLTLEQGGSARVSGEGFMPGSPIYVWLFSEPRFLGELTVGADGSFAGLVPLGDIEVGEHTLQANGTSADGVARSANLGVLVDAVGIPAPGAGELPSTGSDVMPQVLVSLLLLGVGAVVIGRRPRTVR